MASDDEIRQQLADLSARVASLEATVQGVRGARPDPPPVATMAAMPRPISGTSAADSLKAGGFAICFSRDADRRPALEPCRHPRRAYRRGLVSQAGLRSKLDWAPHPDPGWSGLRRRPGGLVRALSPAGICCFFLQPEGAGDRDRLPVALGCFQRFSSGFGRAHFSRHDRGDRGQRGAGLAPGLGTAGPVRFGRRVRHARRCYRRVRAARSFFFPISPCSTRARCCCWRRTHGNG